MAWFVWTGVWVLLMVASGLLAFDVVANDVPVAAGLFMLFALAMAAIGPLGVAYTRTEPGGAVNPQHPRGRMSDPTEPPDPD